MAVNGKTITPAVRAALTEATYDGPRVMFTQQLSPHTWNAVKTVLETLGAMYVVRASAYEFEPDQDARRIVDTALTAGHARHPANAEGYVPTPADLAAEVVARYGQIRPVPGCGRRLKVLEPSAGTGRFVEAVRAELGVPACEITAVEPDAPRAAQIPTDEAVTVHQQTFEDFAAAHTATRFDVVVMNPPFAVPGRPNLWAEHLLTAWELLAPGGRLAAIVPVSAMRARGTSLKRAAVRLVHRHGGAEPHAPKAFAASGTRVATAVVWLDRPLTAAAANPVPAGRPYVFRTYQADETPVSVRRPYLSRHAAETMPVQVLYDFFRQTDRVLRHGADCITCERPVWEFDDGENSPAGPLGNHSPWLSCRAEDYGCVGPTVALCNACGDSALSREAAAGRARAYWAELAQTTATAAEADSSPPPAPFRQCQTGQPHQAALFEIDRAAMAP